jgi:D-amino-acid dehydrogenase
MSHIGPPVDVAVIGGGIVGTSAAAELAARGLRVRLYERTAIAAAASGRNAGVMWRPTDPVLDTLYLETLERYRQLASELPDGPPFFLPAEPVGILSLGRDLVSLAEVAAATAVSLPDLGARYLAPEEVRDLEPGVGPGLGAIRLDIGFPAHPAAATRAFAALASRLGVELRIGGSATLDVSGGQLRGIRSDGELERADVVVVAAGPWTPAVIDPTWGWQPIRSSWGVVVEVALDDPPRHVLDDAGVDEPVVPDLETATAGGRIGFGLVAAAGRTSLGSTALPFEPDPGDWVERLRARGASFVPALADAPVVGTRACPRPLSDDGRPLVGALAGIDRLFVAAGHGPWGISTGPASGRHIADLVTGVRDAVPAWVADALDPARFDPPAWTG